MSSLLKNLSPTKSGWHILENSLGVKVTKEVKFVKAKEPKGVVPTVEKANVEKRKNMANQRVFNKPHNQLTIRF